MAATKRGSLSFLASNALARRTRRVWRALPSLLPLVLVIGGMLLLVSVLPLWQLVLRAFDIDALRWLVSDGQARRALRHSVSVSTIVACFASLLSLGLALLLEKTDLPQRQLFRLALLIPLTIPPQILTVAWLSWAGSAGLLQDALRAQWAFSGRLWTLYNPAGIILLLTIFALPVAYLTVASGLRNIPRSLEDAARVEGADLWRVWRFVTIPLLAPHIAAGFMLSFLAALGNFGIQALLGIPARFITLPTLIYRKVTSFSSGGVDQAAALALLLAAPALLILVVQHRLVNRHDQRSLEMTLEPPLRYSLGVVRRSVLWALGWLLMLLVSIGPLVALLITSIQPAFGAALSWQSLTAEHYRFILTGLDPFRRALPNSLLLAGSASLIAALTALVLASWLNKLRGRAALGLQLVLDLPYALPGLVFSLALILVWIRSPIPGLNIYGSIYILLFAYIGHYLAFALQPLRAAWQQLDSSLEEAAALDGAGPLARLYFVLVPILAPTLSVAGLLVFLNAFSELSLSALLASSRSETLGWLVFNLEQAGYSNEAAALSVILLAVLALLSLVVVVLRVLARRRLS
ncbi:MAG: iron ABC transporter permease [Trueperaceae bacterium]|nr:iron ABC transporter permease [Trueperaceae bacterium]